MSRKANLICRLAIAAIFMASLAGTSFVLLERFIEQPRQAVTIKEFDRPSGVIGGVIQNAQGLPIPNVILTLAWPNRPNGRGRRQRNQLRTNDRGRWSFDGVPKQALGQLQISLEHPDYVPASPPVPAAELLLSQKAVLVMSSGIDVSGQVVDGNGHPIAHARLSTRQQYWVNEGLNIESDSEGRFALRHVGTDPAPILTTQAWGFAPDVQHVQAKDGVAVVRVVLGTGRTVSGVVTDQLGHPLADVAVSVNSWRDFRSVNISATSDIHGHFALRDVPMDGFWAVARKKNYTTQQPWVFPETKLISLAIWYPITISGQVIDGQTHQPISAFTVLNGGKNPNKPDFTFNTPAAAFVGGKYHLDLQAPPDGSDAWYIRVTAAGYRAATSRPVRDSGTVDFMLVKNGA